MMHKSIGFLSIISLFAYFGESQLLAETSQNVASSRDSHTSSSAAFTSSGEQFYRSSGDTERQAQAPALFIDRGYSVSEFSQALRLKKTFLATEKPAPSEKLFVLDTALGKVFFRSPKSIIESLPFSAETSVDQAFLIASQVLSRFNYVNIQPDIDWNVVISSGAISPSSGRNANDAYCHAAWMGPPADIVIDGYRLIHPCSLVETSGKVRGVDLTRSIIHEIGHGLEFRLMGTGFSRRARWHSEGFASWFETEGMKLLGREGEVLESELKDRARDALLAKANDSWRPELFSGSPSDYAMSYALVSQIIEEHSLAELERIYARMATEQLTFQEAVQKTFQISIQDWKRASRDHLLRPSTFHQR